MFVLDWTELESSCQKIAQKSRLHMLSCLLILLRRNPIIWFYIVNTFQTLLPICHVIFLLDCTFPLNRLSHSFCLCRWINLMLCYYTVGVSHYFQPRRWFALTPSISSLWAVASEYFQCGMCWNDPTSDHCTWYRNARVSNQGLACWHKQRRCFGLHSWKLFFFPLLWMLVSNSEKRLSWLGFCVLFVYYAVMISREETLSNYHYKVE